MGELKIKDELFLQGLLEGLSQRKAYRRAFPHTINWKDKTIDERASRLFNCDKVQTRWHELKDKVVNMAEEKAILTVEGLLNDLKDLIERNKENDDRVALDGIKTGMKHLGMFVDKVEHSGEIKLPSIKIVRK